MSDLSPRCDDSDTIDTTERGVSELAVEDGELVAVPVATLDPKEPLVLVTLTDKVAGFMLNDGV